ncbi:MAG: GRAS family protein [Vampirovibrio sp.]|nr:GRAS family protein [Vampirovibrio sp.]
MNTYTKTYKPYERIKNIVSLLRSSQVKKASEEIRTFPKNDLIGSSNEKLLEQYFLDTIHQYIEKNAWEVPNLYLIDDNHEQIKLFNLMAKKFILVTEAQEMVNRLIRNQLTLESCQSDTISIMDIGIGSGQQLCKILKLWYESHIVFPKLIYVYGIEPSVESLSLAQERLEKIAIDYGFLLKFIPFNMTIEEMMVENWSNINEMVYLTGSRLVVNASFSLHHIPIKDRDKIFIRLQNLKPSLFTFIEPYADYITEDLMTKFNSAWQHYLMTFSVIDDMSVTEEEKLSIKTKFFGREIQDIFSENSIERYETAEMWLMRMELMEFCTYNYHKAITDYDKDPRLDYEFRPGYVTLGVHNVPIVTVGSVFSE